jgi:tRNA (guanine-N7-)-methyltransferase
MIDSQTPDPLPDDEVMNDENAKAPGDDSHHRRIKSFVMRAGRMTEGQQRGLDQGKERFVLPLADAPVDFDQVFGRSAPRTLEIGFGMGHSLLEMAAAAPEQDFIGVEVHRPGVGALLNGVLT